MILLRHCRDLTGTEALPWLALAGAEPGLEPERRRRGLAKRLEAAFEAIRDDWYAIARDHAGDPGAALSITLTCSPTMSDFGLLLAWSRLLAQLATEAEPLLVVCDDPWLFRHLAAIPGITAGTAPPLGLPALKLALRGLAARAALALRLGRAARATRTTQANHAPGRPTLLVYGHPGSKPDGTDAYFGPLLNDVAEAQRLLHTDCSAARALELAMDGKSAALHAWGRLSWLPGLLFARWRPRDPSWLIRRAAAREGSTAMAASTLWQMRCQRRWLAEMRPLSLAWPWENHCWERDLVAAARQAGGKTIGYQHTVVGRHMYNQSPRISVLGEDCLPDRILANGPAYGADLQAAGVPPRRLGIAGAIRLAASDPLPYDPQGPVFVALTHDTPMAHQQMEAVRRAAASGPWRFVVKDHPMYPFAFDETESIRRTTVPLQKQPGLAAVFVCTGAVGLEALLGGLPTIRLVPEGVIAQDILPRGITAVEVEGDGLADALAQAKPIPPRPWSEFLSPPDFALWHKELRP